MTKELDARIKKSQAALVAAGLDLLRKNSETSLSDIAQQAGVGRTTLYRLYPTKGHLVKAIAVHCLAAFDAATENLGEEAQSALHAFQLMFEAILPLAAEMEFLMELGELAQDDPELIAMYEKQQRDMTELVEAAKAEGSLSPEVPTPWVVSLVEGLLYTCWLSSDAMDSATLAKLAFRTLARGVATGQGSAPSRCSAASPD